MAPDSTETARQHPVLTCSLRNNILSALCIGIIVMFFLGGGALLLILVQIHSAVIAPPSSVSGLQECRRILDKWEAEHPQQQQQHLLLDRWPAEQSQQHLQQQQHHSTARPQQPARNGNTFSLRTISTKRPLNIIFTLDPRPADQGGKIFETDWIEHSVFGPTLQRPIRIHKAYGGTPPPLLNDSIYVFLYDAWVDELFGKLEGGGYVNFGCYHMGDELGEHDTAYYDKAWMVFRNFWSKRYEADMLLSSSQKLYVPLGVKVGLALSDGAMMMPASRRRHLCNFIGSVQKSRHDMLRSLTYRRSDCVLSTDKLWADPTGVHTIDYRHVLLDSQFTLAPFGNNEESMRFYEALEAGSIPITQFSKSQMGDFVVDGVNGGSAAGVPFPRVKEWGQLDSVLEYYSTRPVEMDALQRDVMVWWEDRKEWFRGRVKGVVDRSFARAYGPGE